MPKEESQFIGNYAVISEGFLRSGNRYVRKSLGEKQGGYIKEEAFNLAHLMQRFYDIANRIDIPIPKIYGYFITKNQFSENINLNQIQLFVGKDLQEVVVEQENPLPAISGYLEIFQRVRDGGCLIALDTHLGNFCQDSDDKVWYIDLMPPRQKLEDGTIFFDLPAPREQMRNFLESRFFTPDGQIPDIYGKLLRAFSYRSQDISSDTPQFIKELMLKNFGRESMAALVENIEKFKKLQVTPTHVDFIRIISAEAFYNGKIGHEILIKIYDLTRLQFIEVLPSQQAIESAMLLLAKGKGNLRIDSDYE